ncbi:inverse autotransporter beta domain-containing protein [Aeromonas sp. HMWF016]|uniref:inverse autotransporter beta domain-containing protein n=1 Tax=Aeromonas sp. HMWF016 TaxID=2056852 RepID=UPI000D38EDF6|nr:inverse autotransporter beta domain-containing protein [Aeromonas sp. HMWF016]PTT45932.1 hypothetical protein DBR09_13370 [Aeromonas sp. HMWF016]
MWSVDGQEVMHMLKNFLFLSVMVSNISYAKDMKDHASNDFTKRVDSTSYNHLDIHDNDGKADELPNLSPVSIANDSFYTLEGVESFIAEQAARIGGKYGTHKLSNDDNVRQKESDYWQQLAESEVHGFVSSSINEQISSSFSKFGTIEFNIGLSKNYTIDQFSGDALIPLQKTSESISYVQVGLRKGSQERSFFNIGSGKRFLYEDYLLGINAFVDYDYSREHARASLGAEYFSDFITISSNGYLPLTGWKSSPDVIDYLEKPSYGVDVRVDGYLPWNPHIGVKAIGEYYSGNEVDILLNGSRTKNPYAITIGANYTPIPLFTLSVNHTEAKDNQNTTNVEAKFNWYIGSSWTDMIEPKNVGGMRTLDNLAMGLVNRNNQIVLKYKKDESVLQVSLPESVMVKEFGSFILMPEVKGAYRTRNYVWSGEILNEVENIYSSQLYVPRAPAYVKDADNTYYVSLLVTDSNNNLREASTIVKVIEDDNVLPTVKLKDKHVKLKVGDIYNIDWSVIDPRNEECLSGCDKTYEKNKIEIIFSDDAISLIPNYELSAVTLTNGVDVKLRVTLPSGHVVEDIMKIEIENVINLRDMDIVLVEETPGLINASVVNNVVLKARVLCNGEDCDPSILSKYSYLWMKKSIFNDEWQDVLLTEDNTYVPTGGPNGGDQGYVFKVRLIEKQDI